MQVWEEHDRLFHYTTQAGLYGILETQTLHATHFQYLNDTTEMYRIAPKLQEIAEPRVREFYASVAKNKKTKAQIDASGGIDKLVEHDSKAIVDAIYKVTFGTDRKFKFFQPYLVSFCAHGAGTYESRSGLLSQWRAYGRDSGYAIVFDTKGLTDIISKEAESHHYDIAELGDVVYEGDDAAFQREFPNLVNSIKETVSMFLKNPHETDFSPLYTPFMGGAARYKHCGFAEEREVRLLFSPTHAAVMEKIEAERSPNAAKPQKQVRKIVRFKESLTPYIVLFDVATAILPITRIIVGPHREKEARSKRLARYLELNGRDIKVDCSETPLN